jgi:hypothetical protein
MYYPVTIARSMTVFKFIQHSFASIVIALVCSGLYAQDLSNVGKSPLLTVSGGFSANQVLFFSHGGTSSSREPYAYTLTGNLNVALYGWTIPLSVIYSNKQWSYSQPFNQYMLAPSYKWIKLYLGNASMSFSPYTLSGHQFWGFGAELTPPGKISGSLMVGRLQKKILPDSSSSVDPAYQRYGAGGKISYQLPFGSFTAIAFYAKDDSSSLPGIADTTLYPQENLCLGLSGNVNVMQSFNFVFDYGLSTLTSNLYAPSMSDYSLDPFYNRRESTHRYHALKTSFSYASPLGSIGAGYERVGAGYATLGAYYNSNDFQNYTINYAGGLFKNKVTLSASYGIQKDNLSGNADQGTTRTVQNLNVGFNPFEKLNMSVYYSNFNTFTHVKSVFDDINTTSPYANLDTLSYTQLSESFGGNLSLSLGSKEKATHRISFTGVFQKASQEQAGSIDYAGTKLFSSSLGYSMGLVNIGLTPSLTVNYNRNINDTLVTEVIGPSFNIRKSLFDKKLSTGLMVSYNQNLLNGVRQGENTILRITISYVLLRKHNFSFSSATALRNSIKSGDRSENTLTLTYSYRFGGKSSKDKR